jgi:AcrR family transcriptional regulator
MTPRSSNEPDHRATRGRGRPLDPSRNAAILRVALDCLAEHGYDRLTMDEIAARAHAGKGTLYRRWPSKAALVVDAVVAWRAGLGPVDPPDTGSLRGDAEAMVAGLREFDASDQPMVGVLLGLVTAASHDGELAAALNANVLEIPRRALRQILDRAMQRGEIPPDRDLSLVPDMIISLNLLRIITGQPVDRAFIRRVLTDLVLPLALGREDASTPEHAPPQ